MPTASAEWRIESSPRVSVLPATARQMPAISQLSCRTRRARAAVIRRRAFTAEATWRVRCSWSPANGLAVLQLREVGRFGRRANRGASRNWCVSLPQTPSSAALIMRRTPKAHRARRSAASAARCDVRLDPAPPARRRRRSPPCRFLGARSLLDRASRVGVFHHAGRALAFGTSASADAPPGRGRVRLSTNLARRGSASCGRRVAGRVIRRCARRHCAQRQSAPGSASRATGLASEKVSRLPSAIEIQRAGDDQALALRR